VRAVLAVLVPLGAVIGLAVGSFLNVVIWRVPRGESVVQPPSACPACGEPIRARDNIPVLSWLVLGGRARCCGAPIRWRYPLVELATAVALVGVVMWAAGSGSWWRVPAFGYLAAISIALWLIDLDVRRLPDVIVLPSYLVGAALLALASLAEDDWAAMLRAVVGGLALWAFYLALGMVYPDGMGWGDIKLSGVLGGYLAWLGWAELVTGAFLGFLLGGLVGAGLMLAGRARRKTKIPFGPFMLAGAWIAVAAGGRIAETYLGLTGL
jgi:leader peptidase (prepilin peptidase)/N-methyltransferase